MYIQTWYLGWATGPLLGGLLADLISFRLTFALCAGIVVAGLTLGFCLVRDIGARVHTNGRVSKGAQSHFLLGTLNVAMAI